MIGIYSFIGIHVDTRQKVIGKTVDTTVKVHVYERKCRK